MSSDGAGALPNSIGLSVSNNDDEQRNSEQGTNTENLDRSKLIYSICESIGRTDVPAPLPNVSSNSLKKVMEYCEYYKGQPLYTPDDTPDITRNEGHAIHISEWDRKFIAVDDRTLMEIILAAGHIKIKPLTKMACKTVYNMIKGKKPHEIGKMLTVMNDFTPEEAKNLKADGWIV